MPRSQAVRPRVSRARLAHREQAPLSGCCGVAEKKRKGKGAREQCPCITCPGHEKRELRNENESVACVVRAC